MAYLIFSWLFFFAGQIADIITTRRALQFPGTSEGNPFVAWLMARTGGAWWFFKLLIALGVAVLFTVYGMPHLISGLGVVMFGIAYRNHRLIIDRGGW